MRIFMIKINLISILIKIKKQTDKIFINLSVNIIKEVIEDKFNEILK